MQRSQSAREKDIQYDPSNLTSFNDTPAGRMLKCRAIAAIEREIMLKCGPPRGSSAKTASVVKQQELLSELCARMNFENNDFDTVVGKLPNQVREYIETLEVIKDRLRSAFSILKKCNGTEARENYHILCTGVATTPVLERNKRGMHRRVTDILDLPHDPRAVPAKQQHVRKDWDDHVHDHSPIKVGDSAESYDGPGTVKALYEDGSISIELKHGAVVKFSSQGIMIN